MTISRDFWDNRVVLLFVFVLWSIRKSSVLSIRKYAHTDIIWKENFL